MFIRIHWLLIRSPELKAQALLRSCVFCHPSRDYFTIIDFSETVERNSMKFDRNVSNPLPNFVFGLIENQERCPGLWLAKTFFDFFSETAEQNSTKLDRKQALNIHYQVRVLGPIGNQDGHPGLWLAETFFTSSLQRLNRIQRNLMGTRSQHFYQFRVFGADGKQIWLPWPLILWVI